MAALEVLISDEKPTLVTGDFNLCYKKNASNTITRKLEDSGFNQLVTEATHIQGGWIDHVYWRDVASRFSSPVVERYSPYYSDHDALLITLKPIGSF